MSKNQDNYLSVAGPLTQADLEKMDFDKVWISYRNAVRFGLVIPQPHQVRFYFESLDVGRMDMA